MDGFSFGVIFLLPVVMPFDLKLLPVEETTTSINAQGAPQVATRTLRLAKPGEVEEIRRTPIGGILRTVYAVDSAGRILSGAYFYAETVANTTTEYSYANGLPIRILWKSNGVADLEETFAYVNGELVRSASYVLPSRDSSWSTYTWKAGRITSVSTVQEGDEFVLNYAYPNADSIHVQSGPFEGGYRLKDGHIVSASNRVYKYGAEVGIRVRPRVLVRGAQVLGRDWLGRKLELQKYTSRSRPNLVPNSK